MNETTNTKSGFRLTKECRLHHKSLIDGLFRFGNSFYEFPFRVVWRVLSPEELRKNFRNNIPEKIGEIQALVSVPKKKRKKAVQRVLIRRRIRESYRLNLPMLRQAMGNMPEIKTLSLAFVYNHDQNLPYNVIETKIRIIMEKLSHKLNSKLENKNV